MIFLRVFAFFVARLPFRALPALGAVLGFVAGTVLRIRRAHVVASMRRAGLDDGAADGMYRSLGTGLLELLWLAGRPSARLDGVARVTQRAAEALDRARAKGRGVVVAATHTGNWDLAACAVAERIELLVVTKHLSVRALDAFWQGSRAARGVVLCGAEGALARGREVLARGGAVAMMIDQVPLSEKHATRAEFLGAEARVDRAPAALAAQTGAPLVVAAARRDACNIHVLEVLAVIEPPARAGRAWIEEASREATRALDDFVRAYPDQWLWLHRRWKAPRALVAAAAAAALMGCASDRPPPPKPATVVVAPASAAPPIASKPAKWQPPASCHPDKKDERSLRAIWSAPEPANPLDARPVARGTRALPVRVLRPFDVNPARIVHPRASIDIARSPCWIEAALAALAPDRAALFTQWLARREETRGPANEERAALVRELSRAPETEAAAALVLAELQLGDAADEAAFGAVAALYRRASSFAGPRPALAWWAGLGLAGALERAGDRKAARAQVDAIADTPGTWSDASVYWELADIVDDEPAKCAATLRAGLALASPPLEPAFLLRLSGLAERQRKWGELLDLSLAAARGPEEDIAIEADAHVARALDGLGDASLLSKIDGLSDKRAVAIALEVARHATDRLDLALAKSALDRAAARAQGRPLDAVPAPRDTLEERLSRLVRCVHEPLGVVPKDITTDVEVVVTVFSDGPAVATAKVSRGAPLDVSCIVRDTARYFVGAKESARGTVVVHH